MDRPRTSRGLCNGWKSLPDRCPDHTTPHEVSDLCPACPRRSPDRSEEYLPSRTSAESRLYVRNQASSSDLFDVEKSQGQRLSKRFRIMRALLGPEQQCPEAAAKSSSSPQRHQEYFDWIRRTASVALRRRPQCSPDAHKTSGQHCVETAQQPIESNGYLQQPMDVLKPSGGAAARAAAAAQNGTGENARIRFSAELGKLREGTAENDSESGIGIDLRDRNDKSLASDVCMNRIGLSPFYRAFPRQKFELMRFRSCCMPSRGDLHVGPGILGCALTDGSWNRLKEMAADCELPVRVEDHFHARIRSIAFLSDEFASSTTVRGVGLRKAKFRTELEVHVESAESITSSMVGRTRCRYLFGGPSRHCLLCAIRRVRSSRRRHMALIG